MSKKPKVIKAWGVFDEYGNLIVVRHNRNDARYCKIRSDAVQRIEIRRVPNAQNRKSA